MKAVVFEAPGSQAGHVVPDPSPLPDEVVIRVAQAGICGTDLHIFRGEYMGSFPLVPGHEFVGEIVALGRDIAADPRGLRVGQRAVGDPNLSCGDCEFCRSLQPNQCRRWQGVGITRAGAFAEFVALPARAVYPISDAIDDVAAAFIEPLACVVYALGRIRVRAGDDVLLYGAGPMGLLLTQALHRVGGGRVTVVEPNAARAALAKQMGADVVLTPVEAAELSSDPGGFHVVVEATGVPKVIERALDHLRPGGTFLQFGVAPIRASASWEPYRIFRNDWKIVGSFALAQTFAPAIRWLEAGAIHIAPLVSHVLPLTQFGVGFDAFARGQTLKVHLRP